MAASHVEEKKRGGRKSNHRNPNRLSEPENGEKGEGRAAVLRCKSENLATFFATFYPSLNWTRLGETQYF